MRVQLLAYEIYTGPTTGDTRRYVGQNSIATDIAERVTLMREAIERAANSPHIDTRTGTLKLFMAPEFYFRGPRGAYELKHIIGAQPGTGLVEQLSALVTNPIYQNWLFVFGTAMAFSEKDSHRWWDSFTPDWFPGSKAWRDYYKEVYNVAVVQPGGASNAKKARASRKVVMKEHRSDIDFLRSPPPGSFSLRRVQHLAPSSDPGPGKELQTRGDDGNSMFETRGISFGLEVCLDHAERRLALSPPSSGQRQVQIQLIPSAGMTIDDAAVAVTANGVVFNVDGLNNGLEGDDEDWGAHSQAIVALKSPILNPSQRKRITALGTERAHTDRAAVTRVFDHRAGDARLRYYQPQDLPPARTQ